MARQTKDKKRVLIDQLSFNFEENIVEHYYKEVKKKEEKEIEKVKIIFRKEFVAIKKSHKLRKTRKIRRDYDFRRN
ncbi:MAG: hypothetical protein IKM43_01240 [Clostridia bacterium]|nr:hypothetical protein [Clostridia bacterium]